MAKQYDEAFAFYEQLRHYYLDNKGRIRRNYKRITLKLLDYNDRSVNPDAFLRPPQFEAFEMYVFVKEFLGNKPMYEIFDDWRKRRGVFADASFYSRGQETLFDTTSDKQTATLFKQMRNVSENYPNYIFALTMGLGKTILMATCIFYEFLLANKFPRDERFCHNALVFAPDKTGSSRSRRFQPSISRSSSLPNTFPSSIRTFGCTSWRTRAPPFIRSTDRILISSSPTTRRSSRRRSMRRRLRQSVFSRCRRGF